jgi:hypothetical protein
MIDTDPDKDRGQELYRMYPGAITALAISRKKQWFDSKQFKGLQNNCKQMDMYIDNNTPAVSTFISDVTPQTLRRSYNENVSLFHKFLETDPLFSVRRSSKMTYQQELNINLALTDNLEKTYFRERTLTWLVDHIVRYGTAITYSFAVDDYNANSLLTIKGEDGYGDYSQKVQSGENAIISTTIHPLNVIFDSRANFMVAPDYLGFIGDISVANVATLQDNPNYVQKNLKKVFNMCKTGLPDEHWYGGPPTERKDYSRGHSNITYMWTRLPIEGNEDDPNWYPIEMIGDEIIRIEQNVLDQNCIPLAIMRILPRQYTWYGNSPLVDKISIQNLQYWLLNTTIESTARAMDRIILYKEGSLDVEGLHSRHQAGGLVPVKGTEQNLEKLLYSVQIPPVGLKEASALWELMKREDADSGSMPNFNPMAEGGPVNKTLGGAQMMASIGELKMSTMVNQMANGMKDIARHQVILMRNIMGDTLTTSNGQEIPKEHLLGNIWFSAKVSNVFNYIREGVDSQNRLTQLINYLATQRPEFKAVNVGQYIVDWARNSLKRENIGDYIDEQLMVQIEQQQKKAAMQPPPPPPPEEPSQSINFKDLPPAGQVQMAAKAGINLGQPQQMAPGQAPLPQHPGMTPLHPSAFPMAPAPPPVIPGAKQ